MSVIQLVISLFSIAYLVESRQILDCGRSGLLLNATLTTREDQSMELVIRFRTDRLVTYGQPRAMYWTESGPSPYLHFPQVSVCQSTSPRCPFQPDGTIYTYQQILSQRLPSNAPILTWKLRDQNDRSFLCLLIRV